MPALGLIVLVAAFLFSQVEFLFVQGQHQQDERLSKLNISESWRWHGRYDKCFQLVSELTDRLVGPTTAIDYMNPSDLQYASRKVRNLII